MSILHLYTCNVCLQLHFCFFYPCLASLFLLRSATQFFAYSIRHVFTIILWFMSEAFVEWETKQKCNWSIIWKSRFSFIKTRFRKEKDFYYHGTDAFLYHWLSMMARGVKALLTQLWKSCNLVVLIPYNLLLYCWCYFSLVF